MQNLFPKDIAGYDIMNLKVSQHVLVGKVLINAALELWPPSNSKKETRFTTIQYSQHFETMPYITVGMWSFP